MNRIEKALSVLDKLEKLDPSWTCEIEQKDESGKTVGKRQTHLRSVPPATGKLLKSLVVITKSKKILELGCSGGYSAIWMALGAFETGGRVITTEFIPEKVKFANQNFKDAGVESKIRLYEGDILETLRKNNFSKIDFVFIDADKAQYPEYYKKVLPLLKKGGVIVADNMLSHESDLEGFVELLKKDKRISFEIISVDSGLLVARKK